MQLRSGWSPTLYPCCVGHEIVGTAIRVGTATTKGIKIGDRVGVGAQSQSCLKPDCEECSSGLESYCSQAIGTYNDKFLNDKGKSYGGYSNFARVPGHFVVRIPDGLESAQAAPMLCGGITTYTPLTHNGAGPGKKVAIIGVGGLGHFGILWAKALGCDKITAISRTSSKKEDALKMGADDFIATDESDDWANKHSRSLDLIVCTVSSPKMPLEKYLKLLKTKGSLIQVGAPEDNIPGFSAFSLMTKGAKIGGSAIGAPHEIEEMLALAVRKNIRGWVEERPLKEANQAILDMDAGKARYRYTLVNEAHVKL
jgi:alcohol dehydrogenase (NADP+)